MVKLYRKLPGIGWIEYYPAIKGMVAFNRYHKGSIVLTGTCATIVKWYLLRYGKAN